MKKYVLLASLFAIIPLSLMAAAPTTVFRPDAGTMYSYPNIKGLATSVAAVQIPTTATAPSSTADGIGLASLSATYDVYVEVSTRPTEPADDAGTCVTSTSGDKDANAGFSNNRVPTFTLRAYLMNPTTSAWARAAAHDIAVTGNVTSFIKAGITRPTDTGRIAYVVPADLACPTNTYIVSKR